MTKGTRRLVNAVGSCDGTAEFRAPRKTFSPCNPMNPNTPWKKLDVATDRSAHQTKGRVNSCLRSAGLYLLLSLGLTCPLVAQAAPAVKDGGPSCKTITNASGFLYKSQNVHGGRGPSFLCGYKVQRLWPPSHTLAVRNKSGSIIARLGLYDPGHPPYGRRYYSGVGGGSYTSAIGFLNGAKRAGSTNVFIDFGNGTCFKVNNPTSDRQGSVF